MNMQELYTSAINIMASMKASGMNYSSHENMSISVILTDKEKIYQGITSTSLLENGDLKTTCSERNAISSMILAKETKISKIISVSFKTNSVVRPCEECLKLIASVNEENKGCSVGISKSEGVTLESLLQKGIEIEKIPVKEKTEISEDKSNDKTDEETQKEIKNEAETKKPVSTEYMMEDISEMNPTDEKNLYFFPTQNNTQNQPQPQMETMANPYAQSMQNSFSQGGEQPVIVDPLLTPFPQNAQQPTIVDPLLTPYPNAQQSNDQQMQYAQNQQPVDYLQQGYVYNSPYQNNNLYANQQYVNQYPQSNMYYNQNEYNQNYNYNNYNQNAYNNAYQNGGLYVDNNVYASQQPVDNNVMQNGQLYTQNVQPVDNNLVQNGQYYSAQPIPQTVDNNAYQNPLSAQQPAPVENNTTQSSVLYVTQPAVPVAENAEKNVSAPTPQPTAPVAESAEMNNSAPAPQPTAPVAENTEMNNSVPAPQQAAPAFEAASNGVGKFDSKNLNDTDMFAGFDDSDAPATSPEKYTTNRANVDFVSGVSADESNPFYEAPKNADEQAPPPTADGDGGINFETYKNPSRKPVALYDLPSQNASSNNSLYAQQTTAYNSSYDVGAANNNGDFQAPYGGNPNDVQSMVFQAPYGNTPQNSYYNQSTNNNTGLIGSTKGVSTGMVGGSIYNSIQSPLGGSLNASMHLNGGDADQNSIYKQRLNNLLGSSVPLAKSVSVDEISEKEGNSRKSVAKSSDLYKSAQEKKKEAKEAAKFQKKLKRKGLE